METTETPTPEPASSGSALKNRRWLAAGAATLALLTAGFGMGVAQAQDDGGSTTTAPAQDGAPAEEGDEPTEEEIQAFRDCMAENGVELPDERPAPGERPERTEEERQAFREALEACEDLKPEGFGPGCGRGPGGPRPDQEEAPEGS